MRNQRQILSYVMFLVLTAVLALTFLYVPIVNTVVELEGGGYANETYTLFEFLKNDIITKTQCWITADGGPVWLIPASIILNLLAMGFAGIVCFLSVVGIVAYIFKKDNNRRFNLKSIALTSGLLGIIAFALNYVGTMLLNNLANGLVEYNLLEANYVLVAVFALFVIFAFVASSKKKTVRPNKFVNIFVFVLTVLLIAGFVFCLFQPIFQESVAKYLFGDTAHSFFAQTWYDLIKLGTDDLIGPILSLVSFGALCATLAMLLGALVFHVLGLVKVFQNKNNFAQSKYARLFTRLSFVFSVVFTITVVYAVVAILGSVVLYDALYLDLVAAYGNTSYQVFSYFAYAIMAIPAFILILNGFTARRYKKDPDNYLYDEVEVVEEQPKEEQKEEPTAPVNPFAFSFEKPEEPKGDEKEENQETEEEPAKNEEERGEVEEEPEEEPAPKKARATRSKTTSTKRKK